MNTYTSTKYKNFTVACLNNNNTISIFSTIRGMDNILLYDEKNLPTKLSEQDLYFLLESKYENKRYTLDYIKQNFNIERY